MPMPEKDFDHSASCLTAVNMAVDGLLSQLVKIPTHLLYLDT